MLQNNLLPVKLMFLVKFLAICYKTAIKFMIETGKLLLSDRLFVTAWFKSMHPRFFETNRPYP